MRVAHAEPMHAIDVSEPALELARSFRAAHTLTPPSAEAIGDLTGGGVHLGIDALGRASTFADLLAGLRRRGRHVQVGLLVADDANPPVDMGAVLARELEVVGSHGMAARDYPAMLAEIAAGKLDPRRLVSRVITLDDAPDGLVAMSVGSAPATTVVSFG